MLFGTINSSHHGINFATQIYIITLFFITTYTTKIDHAMVLSQEVTDNLVNGVQFDLEALIKELPENLQSVYLLDCKNQLERLLTTVTHDISGLILKHQPTYVGELKRVTDLNKSIIDCIKTCSKGRQSLKFIKECPTILERYRERESLMKLLKSLTAISELRKFVIEIQNLIDCQDLTSAIQMCKDGQLQVASFDQYKCVNDLGIRLNDMMEFISDSVISQLCTNYDLNTYPELRDAYNLLDRRELLVDRALNFFTSFHSSAVEELKMFLANESWEMLPVKSDFNVMQLKEFAFLRESTPNKDSFEDLFGAEDNHQQQAEQSSYFDQPDALPLDRISLSSDSDLDSELDKDYVDEDEVMTVAATSLTNNNTMGGVGDGSGISTGVGATSSKSSNYRLTRSMGPVLTNSSLNVLRLAGRYIQKMNVLGPISFEILMNIYKLLDQYIIFVFKKFGSDDDKKLKDVIASLRESLISDRTTIDNASEMLSKQAKISSNDQAKHNNNNQQQQQQPPTIDPKKAVAIESLIFLVNQLWNLHEYLITLISPEQQAQLREQFSRRNSTIPDFLKARAELGPARNV